MKNFLVLDTELPSIKAIKVSYYLLQIISISLAIVFILDGLADPFGELTILIATTILILVPISLRILFGLLLDMAKNRNKSSD